MSAKRFLLVAARVFLGLVFVYAAWHKIHYPPAFAKEIVPYGLLPGKLVNLMAIYMPWLEILCGAALIVGIWSRAAASMIAGMLVLFLLAIASRFVRGEWDFDCGCFAKTSSWVDSVPVLAQLKWFFFSSPKAYITFARDLVFLGLAIVTIRANPETADSAAPPPIA